MKQFEGDFKTPRGKIAILAARFNDLAMQQLIQGAEDMLLRHGLHADDVALVRVPGARELPYAAQQIANTQRYAGIVSLGVVIRGQTPDFDYLCSTCISGLQQVSLTHNIPITCGVITADNMEQALDRSGLKVVNKGSEAAVALIEMMRLTEVLHGND
jgi:6,7-dimethyl-8-ribityllumazine synthase